MTGRQWLAVAVLDEGEWLPVLIHVDARRPRLLSRSGAKAQDGSHLQRAPWPQCQPLPAHQQSGQRSIPIAPSLCTAGAARAIAHMADSRGPPAPRSPAPESLDRRRPEGPSLPLRPVTQAPRSARCSTVRRDRSVISRNPDSLPIRELYTPRTSPSVAGCLLFCPCVRCHSAGDRDGGATGAGAAGGLRARPGLPLRPPRQRRSRYRPARCPAPPPQPHRRRLRAGGNLSESASPLADGTSHRAARWCDRRFARDDSVALRGGMVILFRRHHRLCD
jgi:hypothetical protein